MAEIVYRHNRITRLTHWSNALALTILFMSGLMIFNAHPNLYWGSNSDPGTEFLAIGSQRSGNEVRGFVRFYDHSLDTTGFFGVQTTVEGVNRRAFPSWATVPGYYSLASARRWHFFFGWLFTFNGLLYVAYNLAVGHLRKFFLTPADAARIPAMIAYYLHLRKDSPQQDEYNPLQKMAYSSVFVLLAPMTLLTGMAMSPQLNMAFHWLPALFGGRQSARTFHFVLAFSFLFFAFGHVFMVLTQGFFNNMRSMITGWYRGKLPHMAIPSSIPAVPTTVAPPTPERNEGNQTAHSRGPNVETSPANDCAVVSAAETNGEVAVGAAAKGKKEERDDG